jgi:8-oxo-dGTP pyrophosphatase MutT (NUDIX family)
MVQRKDSLGFVEFVRGKYDISDHPYIGALLGNMTPEEREKVESADTIDVLWEHLWRDLSNSTHGTSFPPSKPAFVKDLEDARTKFHQIKKMLPELLQSHESQITETEWGFPKGRRNTNETDMECAFREFQEETGLSHRYLRMPRDGNCMEEMFQGSNGVWYRHCYFTAKATPKLLFNCQNGTYKHVNGEIRAVAWFDYDACMRRIREVYPQRKKLLHQLHTAVIESMQNMNINNIYVDHRHVAASNRSTVNNKSRAVFI